MMIGLEFMRCLGELLLEEDLPDKVRSYRFQALQNTYEKATCFLEKGFLPELVEAFFVQKVKKLSDVQTKNDMELFVEGSKPRYTGGKLEPDGNPFYSEEEELMVWSLASMDAPLAQVGYERYMELFRKYFPNVAVKEVRNGVFICFFKGWLVA